MKKFLWFFAGVVFATGLTVFAEQIENGLFKDDASFDSWYKTSVYKMRDAGVINGHADGNFMANNYVTRAELAVMLDRYDAVVDDEIFKFIYALDDLGQINLGTNKFTSAAVLMAESGFKMIDKLPAGVNIDDLNLVTGVEGIPQGYSLYVSPYESYLRYQGERSVRQEEGEDVITVDQWYGPFSIDSPYMRYKN